MTSTIINVLVNLDINMVILFALCLMHSALRLERS
jgi:hypothetical protein